MRLEERLEERLVERLEERLDEVFLDNLRLDAICIFKANIFYKLFNISNT